MFTGLYVPTFNDYSEPRHLVVLAQAAEAAGFDGFFISDQLSFEPDRMAETSATVMLGALAQATRKLRLGAMITPLARRRPWAYARELVTLDHLSHGRIIAGIGLGGPAETDFGVSESPSLLDRARRLDEGLAILDPLLRGESVTHQGQHYQLRNARLALRPVQQPRVPLWIAAALPAQAGFRRAAHWDGCFPIKMPAVGAVIETDRSDQWLSPPEMETAAARLRDWRTDAGLESNRYDLVASGRTLYDRRNQAETFQRFKASGATWWMEWVLTRRGTFEETLAAVRLGPPASMTRDDESTRATLRASIQSLHAEITKATQSDRASLAELHRLALAIEVQLDRDPSLADQAGGLHNLREQLERVELAHPRATGILNDILMMLSNLGI